MATTADVLRSVNAILQSGERREQYKVQSALAMMQFAQQKRMQDVALTQKNLDLAQKSLQTQKPIVASEFLSATGLGGIYVETEPGESAEGSISEMVDTLRSKQYLGRKYDKEKARAIAGAVWNYYSAEDPTSIIRLGSNLYDASVAIEAGVSSEAQEDLFDSFKKLGITADLKDISMAAKKARVSERYISKEISEFLQGDYDIQSPIGIYAEVPEAVEEADMDRRLQEQPVSASNIEMETTREALRMAEAKYKGLQNKMDTKMASDEEQEEFYALPALLERYRSELDEKSGVVKQSVEGDIGNLADKIEEMNKLGLGRSPEVGALKQMIRNKRVERLDLMKKEASERERSRVSKRIEDISQLLEIPESEAKERVESEKTWMEGGTRWADEPGFRF